MSEEPLCRKPPCSLLPGLCLFLEDSDSPTAARVAMGSSCRPLWAPLPAVAFRALPNVRTTQMHLHFCRPQQPLGEDAGIHFQALQLQTAMERPPSWLLGDRLPGGLCQVLRFAHAPVPGRRVCPASCSGGRRHTS